MLQIAKYFHPDKGGIETVTGSIGRTLPLHGVTADVLCFARDRDYSGFDYPFRVQRARTAHFFRDRPLSFEYLRLLRRSESEYDAALLHLPNPLAALGVLTHWTKPFVILWHADIVGYGAAGRLFRPVERALVERASGVIAPTPAHVEGSYLAREIGPKATIIPFPFDRGRFSEHTTFIPGLDAIEQFVRGRRLVLALARLVRYKGIDVLVEASRHFPADVAVCVVGVGPLRERLLRQIERVGVGDRVLLAGDVPDEALPTLLRRTHVVVLPSVTRAEMYGLSQVEAMAFGKPVVSTKIPGSGVPYVNLDGQT
ncbi:MAG: glycosyltransferase, partial [Candidatus Thermoplasmatota archaeon]